MSRHYKVALPLTVHTADGAYKQGETFEADFTVEQETQNLESGLLELEPITYKVVGGSTVYDTPPGGTFEMALPLGNEQQLVEGGHIERVKTKPAPAPAEKRTTRKKEA